MNVNLRRYGFNALLVAVCTSGLLSFPALERAALADNPSQDGAIHNACVGYVLSNLPPNWRCIGQPEPCNGGAGPSFPTQQLIAVVNQLGASFAQNNQLLFEYGWPPAQMDFHQNVNDLVGQGAISENGGLYLHALVDTIQANSGATLVQFNQELDMLEMQADINLEGTDRDRFFSASSIARSSGNLWAAQGQGGINGISYIPGEPDPEDEALRINWGEVVCHDCIGRSLGGVVGEAIFSVGNILHQIF